MDPEIAELTHTINQTLSAQGARHVRGWCPSAARHGTHLEFIYNRYGDLVSDPR